MIIYSVYNPISKKVYIGKTSRSLRTRWSQHVWHSRNGSELPLHRAIRKYGPEVFVTEIIAEATSEEQLNHLEMLFILTLGTVGKGYNCTYGGEGGYRPCSEETRQKMRVTQRERADDARLSAVKQWSDPQARAEQSARLRGKKRTAANKLHIGDATKFRWQDPEYRKRLSEAHKARWQDPEFRARQMESRKKARENRSVTND